MTIEVRPLSISAVRRYLRCPYAWYLRYVEGHRPLTWTGTFFGRVAHQIIKAAYGGHPLPAAHRRVWREHFSDLFLERLDAFVELDRDYTAQGGKRSKAAKEWLASHPSYLDLKQELDETGQGTLAHVQWGKESLTDIYRRSTALSALDRDEVLLPQPILVEGQPFHDPDFGKSDDDDDHLHLLHANLDGIPICGVPDVLAETLDETAVVIADYKTGRRAVSAADLREDAQLILYRYLCIKADIIAPDDVVFSAHARFDKTGFSWVTVKDDSAYERGLERLRQQFAAGDEGIRKGRFFPVKGLDQALSPCAWCDVRHVCCEV